MDTATIEFEQDILREFEFPSPGDLTDILAFRVRLMKNNRYSGTHVVVQAHYPAWTGEQCDRALLRLGDLVAGCVVSFIVEDAEGKTTVFSGPGSDSVPPFDVAAVVAHVKRRCGWDESNPMSIRIGEIEIPIWFHYDGRDWLASSH